MDEVERPVHHLDFAYRGQRYPHVSVDCLRLFKPAQVEHKFGTFDLDISHSPPSPCNAAVLQRPGCGRLKACTSHPSPESCKF